MADEVILNDGHSMDPKRLKKKRRRRKISRSKVADEETTNGYSDEEYSSDDEDLSQSEESIDQSDSSKCINNTTSPHPQLVITDCQLENKNSSNTNTLPIVVNGHSHHIHDQSQPRVEAKHQSGDSIHQPSTNSIENSNQSGDPAVISHQSTDPIVESRRSNEPIVNCHESENPTVKSHQSEAPIVNSHQSNAGTVDNLHQSNQIEDPGQQSSSVIVETTAVPSDQSKQQEVPVGQSEAPILNNDVSQVKIVDKDESSFALARDVVIDETKPEISLLVRNGTSDSADIVLEEVAIVETNKNSLDSSNVLNSELTNSVVLHETEDIVENNEVESINDKPKYRVEAEEFVPRAYRQQHNFENHMSVTNFIPLPIINDMYPPNFPNPAFMPPLNFLPGVHHYDKFVPNFIPNQYFINREQFYAKNQPLVSNTPVAEDGDKVVAKSDKNDEEIKETKVIEQNDDKKDGNVVIPTQSSIDIAKIVSKLEEAAMEQKKNDDTLVTVKNVVKNNNIVNKTSENNRRSSPKKYIDRRQNSYEKTTRKLPENHKTEVDTKPESIVIKTEPIKIDQPIVRLEPTFSKMLKTSTSLTENKPSDFKPLFKKQISLNTSVKAPSSKNITNYSESVKKSFKRGESTNICPRFDRNRKYSDSLDKKPQKEVVKNTEVVKKEVKPVSVDSWINVSSRKKRKNKSNDFDSFEQTEESQQLEIKNTIESEPCIEECVAEIEKTYELQQEKAQEKLEIEKIVIENSSIEETKAVVEVPNAVTDESNSFTKIEKKSKRDKPKNKTNKKRIIINDKELENKNNAEIPKQIISTNLTDKKIIEVISKPEEIKESKELLDKQSTEKEIVIECETIEDKPNEIIMNEKDVIVIEEIREEEIPIKTETEVIKSKKKKRKSKVNKDKSQDSPNLASTEENYDFLIESSSIADPDSKTNVEISLEIDKMIQRGLYANLEEKLKTFNPSDSFIKSVVTEDFNFDVLKPSDTGNAFRGLDKIKNFDFSGVLFNTPMSKQAEKNILTASVTEEKIDEPEELKKTAIIEDFKQDINEIENDDVKTETQDLVTTENVLSNGMSDGINSNGTVNSMIKNKHFPITQAVKEWMSKTRENTPEIEILKSVNEIRSEYLFTNLSEDFPDDDDNVEAIPMHVINSNGTAVTNGYKNSNGTRESSHERTPDLLDCWEPDIDVKSYEKHSFFKNGDQIVQNGVVPEQNGHIEQGEDVLEIYDSVYGKNTDFLKIQKEIEEKNNIKSANNYPKDGGLPYRAICCNVM